MHELEEQQLRARWQIRSSAAGNAESFLLLAVAHAVSPALAYA